MDKNSSVLLERRESSLWITINRPERRNAINDDVVRGITDGYRSAQDDPTIRSIVVTGAGNAAFCAGGDLQPGKTFAFDYAKPTNAYADLFRLAVNATVPTIARVNGACMAGGMGFLCMTDLAVAADNALFGLPEVKVGVFPMQVLALLQGMVPPRVLREWCMTGESFDAQTALAHGLINYSVPAALLDDKIDGLLRGLANRSPTAIRRGKYAMRAIEGLSFEKAIAFMESQIALTGLTEDAKEGVAAFTEKRKPVWTNK